MGEVVRKASVLRSEGPNGTQVPYQTLIYCSEAHRRMRRTYEWQIQINRSSEMLFLVNVSGLHAVKRQNSILPKNTNFTGVCVKYRILPYFTHSYR